jgi:hypothetical protein
MSGNVTVSEAPTTGLGQLITENRFFVPTHQRDYKWDRDRVEKFFDDLKEAMEHDDKFYFVGLMVFMREAEKLRVLDGQQRLATAMIIFSALRSWFGGSGADQAVAPRIQYDFIGRAEYGEQMAEPKLSLNRNNDDKFQAYVVNASPLSEITAEVKQLTKNHPNYQLLDAILYCHDRISKKAEELKSAKFTSEYFSKFIKFLRDSVVVVRLTVPNESNAFRVFETLNDRGMDLSSMDLLKNYLFGLAYDKSPVMLEHMEHRWSQLTETLKEARQEEFLKVFWTSRHGRTQLDDVFDEVKKAYKTPEEATELSMDLLEASEHFAAFDSSDDPTWHPFSDKSREAISNLQILGSKQVRPVILSAIKRFTPTEFERLLRLLEVVIVRWQLIGEERTGTLEIQCAKLAESIWKNRITTATDAFKSIDAIYLDDKVFHGKFSEKNDLTNSKATYLLKKIEQHERDAQLGGSGRELEPHRALTLEHILPKNPGDEWKDALEKDAKFSEECTFRLGNMCLLTESRNRDVARAGFPKKKALFLESDLLTTKQIGKGAQWDRRSVQDRQDWLAARAVSVWRFQ